MATTSQMLVVLAHAPGADAHAERIAAQLAALGYTIDRDVTGPGVNAARARARRIAAAHLYVVLWSREAAKAPALRAAAKHALRAGKLASVRLDKTSPPVGGADAIALPRGRAQARAWRRLLEQAAPAAARSGAAKTASMAKSSIAKADTETPRARKGGFGLGAVAALLALTLAAGAAGYFTNTSFAAQVDGVAEKAQAMVERLAG